MTLPEYLRTATEVVRAACALCRNVQFQLVSAETLEKKDRSPVTVADFGVQALVSDWLHEVYPDISMVGEEDAEALRRSENLALRDRVVAHITAVRPTMDTNSTLIALDRGTHPGGAIGRFWTLDPIDGTKGFLRRDQYAVALALIENGQVVLGVLGCPNLPVRANEPQGPRGCLFAAVKGVGATMQPLDDGAAPQPIRVAATTNPTDAVVCESVESAHSAHDDSARVAELLGITRPPFRIDSQCKYAAVARGDSSIYLRMPTRADYQERIWDHAAGWMIVTEAGGRVTDIRGTPLDFSRGRTLERNVGVVATNGKLHDAVIDAVRKATQPS